MLQAEEYTAADAEVMELMDQHDREKLDDPLSKLEHHTDVMIRKKAQNERLVDLRDDSNAKYKNDYGMNKLLRKNLRYVAMMFMGLHIWYTSKADSRAVTQAMCANNCVFHIIRERMHSSCKQVMAEFNFWLAPPSS